MLHLAQYRALSRYWRFKLGAWKLIRALLHNCIIIMRAMACTLISLHWPAWWWNLKITNESARETRCSNYYCHRYFDHYVAATSHIINFTTSLQYLTHHPLCGVCHDHWLYIYRISCVCIYIYILTRASQFHRPDYPVQWGIGWPDNGLKL